MIEPDQVPKCFFCSKNAFQKHGCFSSQYSKEILWKRLRKIILWRQTFWQSFLGTILLGRDLKKVLLQVFGHEHGNCSLGRPALNPLPAFWAICYCNKPIFRTPVDLSGEKGKCWYVLLTNLEPNRKKSYERIQSMSLSKMYLLESSAN